MPAKELMGIVRPFASETEAKTILGSLAKENLLYWEENTGSLVSLTAQGKQFYQDCWEKQKLIRQKAMEGIGETDYQIAVQTLQKMASNLENP
jgi:DNA-binding MarR family transcriptional regulator